MNQMTRKIEQFISTFDLAMVSLIMLLLALVAFSSVGCTKQQIAGGCCLTTGCEKYQIRPNDPITGEALDATHSCWTDGACTRCEKLGG